MIETRVNDETIRLYGFFTAEEREWFRLLQTVQNVGARVALNVLSALSPRELERALALGDKAVIGRAQGVGPETRTAHRDGTEGQGAVDDAARPCETQQLPAIAPRGSGSRCASRRSSSSATARPRRRKRWRAPRAIWASMPAPTC